MKIRKRHGCNAAAVQRGFIVPVLVSNQKTQKKMIFFVVELYLDI